MTETTYGKQQFKILFTTNVHINFVCQQRILIRRFDYLFPNLLSAIKPPKKENRQLLSLIISFSRVFCWPSALCHRTFWCGFWFAPLTNRLFTMLPHRKHLYFTYSISLLTLKFNKNHLLVCVKKFSVNFPVYKDMLVMNFLCYFFYFIISSQRCCHFIAHSIRYYDKDTVLCTSHFSLVEIHLLRNLLYLAELT